MNLESIKNLATSKIARQALQTRKHSPTILLVAGTVGVVGTVVLACRATLKVSDVMDKLDIQKTVNGQMLATDRNYTQDEFEKQNHKLQLKAIVSISKLYVPAAGLGIVSIAALTGSHIILTKRNTAVMAAYAALDRGYKEYRQRVSDTYGKDVDRKFVAGGQDIEVEEDLADGTTKKTKKTVFGNESKYGGSPYAAMFDETSRFFTVEPGMNAQIIMMKQNYANDKLKAQGHLFLNEFYDMFGLPRTPAGAAVGWVYDPDNANHTGDNYVTANVFDGDPEWVEAFMDGREKYVVIDPNVDGVIWDKI